MRLREREEFLLFNTAVHVIQRGNDRQQNSSSLFAVSPFAQSAARWCCEWKNSFVFLSLNPSFECLKIQTIHVESLIYANRREFDLRERARLAMWTLWTNRNLRNEDDNWQTRCCLTSRGKRVKRLSNENTECN